MQLSDIYNYLIEKYIELHEESVVVLSGVIKIDKEYQYEDYQHIEELALEIRKSKSYPMLDITSESLRQRTLYEVPEEKYFVPSDYYTKWTDLFDVIIDVSFPNFFNLKTQLILSEATREYVDSSIQKIYRNLVLSEKKMLMPNFPKDSIASYLNISLADLSRFYTGTFEPISLKMRAFGQKIVNRLATEELFNFIMVNEESNISFQLCDDNIVNQIDTFSNVLTYLPFGYVKANIDKSTLNAKFTAERVYYKNRYWFDVDIELANGSIVYMVFKQSDVEQEFVRNALINSQEYVEVYIGTNNGVEEYCNYHYYDRCILNNTSIVFYDEENSLIQISTRNIKF
jgi:hypothetical protein